MRPFAGAESGSPGRAIEAGKRGSPGRAVQAGIRGKRLMWINYLRNGCNVKCNHGGSSVTCIICVLVQQCTVDDVCFGRARHGGNRVIPFQINTCFPLILSDSFESWHSWENIG